MKKEFKDWLISENYRIAKEYRLLLWQEYNKAKIFFGAINEIVKPVLISALRKIELPPYNKYDGNLDRKLQIEIFNKIPKIEKQDILVKFILENF